MRNGGLLAVTSLALLAACDKKVDTADMQNKIKAQIPGAQKVDCPGGVRPEQGKTVECKVALDDGNTYPLIVSIDEVDGDRFKFSSRFKDPLIATTALVELLTPSVRGQTNDAVNVDCGTDKYLTRPADGVLWCSISDGHEQAKIRVQLDEELNVKDWAVAEPPAQ